MCETLKIDCSVSETWEIRLVFAVLQKYNAELVNYDPAAHGQACRRIADRLKAEITVESGASRALVKVSR